METPALIRAMIEGRLPYFRFAETFLRKKKVPTRRQGEKLKSVA